MDRLQSKSLSKELNDFSCKGCTEAWLKNCGLTDPIKDIKDCGSFGFISSELEERLIKDVKEINAEN